MRRKHYHSALQFKRGPLGRGVIFVERDSPPSTTLHPIPKRHIISPPSNGDKVYRLSLLLWTALSLVAAQPSYFREIRPMLQHNCQGCHQPNLKSSNLDLTAYESLKAGGKHGPAFGLLVQYLTGELKPQMPLGMPPLTADQIDLVRSWVAAGAKDDTPEEARETITAGAPTVYSLPPVLTALAFSPDGKMLAVSGNHEILLHTLDGGAPPKRLPGLSERIL